MKPHSLQLCADDFGLSDGVCLGVLDLIGRGRLTATSCMMAGPALEAHASALLSLSDRVDIGMHLTLTDLDPLDAMPKLCPDGRPPRLKQLMQSAFLRDLDAHEIAAEIARQIARFEAVFGRAPDFIDGHQHVHLLPGIRGALFDAYRDGRLPKATAIRSCAEPIGAIIRRGVEVPKTIFISVLSTGVATTAGKLSIPVNDSFRGVTAFHADRPFGPTFRRFLEGQGFRPLAMCHPGLPDYPPHPTDVIATARTLEYAYFASDAFADDLAQAGVVLARSGR